MGCLVYGLIFIFFFVFIIGVIEAILGVIEAILPYLYIAAVIWLVVYFVIRTIGTRDGASRKIDSDLRKVLAQVEGQEPIEVRPALSTTSVGWQESVLTDSEWGNLAMTFVRDTEDGKIYTTVRLEQERATVRMDLNGSDSDKLVDLDYVSSLHGGTPHGQKESPEAVRHVREWMRRRILPELEAAKTRRESESRRLVAERDAKLEEERRKLEKLRQKYLP